MNIQEYIWHEIKLRPEVARERVIEIKLLVEINLQWEAVLTGVAHDFRNSIQNYWDNSLTTDHVLLFPHPSQCVIHRHPINQHSITYTFANVLLHECEYSI